MEDMSDRRARVGDASGPSGSPPRTPSSDGDDDRVGRRKNERRRCRLTVADYCEDRGVEDVVEEDIDEDVEDIGGGGAPRRAPACRDYECPRCARRFPASRFLAQHARPDAKKCPLCCKRFRHVSNLTNHARVHTGEKPYACAACGRAFAQSGNLRTHARIHSGDAPHACDLCPRRFVQAGNLVTHRRRHDAAAVVVARSGSEDAGPGAEEER